MKYIKLYFITLSFGAILFSSCKKDFFEVKDPNGLSADVAFDDVGAVGYYLNRTYALVIPQWPVTNSIHISSDESNDGNTTFLYGTLLENGVTDIGTGTGITANRYADIRRCNLAIEGLTTSTGIDNTQKNIMKGQFYFLRAFSYFRLVRLYGGVPLVLTSQSVGDENLTTPRSKTSECIAQIAKDLDSAVALLPASWSASESGRVTRGAAAALKGKALLQWASPQFNLTNDAQRWNDAYTANKAAYDMCVADGYILLPNYANIYTTEDHKENLIFRKYSPIRDWGNDIERLARPFSETVGGSGNNYQPTWNLVQAYPMIDGQPITAGTSGYNATQFWLNRDPRLAASIAYNGTIWPLSGKAGRKQWQYTGVLDETAGSIITGFYNRKFCNTTITAANVLYNSNVGGGSGVDYIEMRFAEVIANLAECANETNKLTEAKDMIRLLRVRAGIIAGTMDYGLALASNQAQMRSLILNERQVEFALEGGMRYHDLRRTRNLNLITARQAYKVTVKSPYAAGTGTNPAITYLDMFTATGVKHRDTANLNNSSVYTRIFNAPTITSLEGGNVIIMPSKYYVYPLPTLFTQTPGIEQTIGWNGGSFDPYQ
ncbi:MAG: RagB/SusD family nutrient uptake outer membrane protein [Ferruginibacter sp.]|nr:RagB/SusD family nutrient uptake outer membrane protein [Ferruginibacter sp.]